MAEQQLDELEKKWGAKYPVVISSWRNNWHKLSCYFKYAKDIRKLIYTTNTIEGFHRQVRKVTKTKTAFTTDMAVNSCDVDPPFLHDDPPKVGIKRKNLSWL